MYLRILLVFRVAISVFKAQGCCGSGQKVFWKEGLFPRCVRGSISEHDWSSPLILFQLSKGQGEKDAAKLDAAANEADDVGDVKVD